VNILTHPAETEKYYGAKLIDDEFILDHIDYTFDGNHEPMPYAFDAVFYRYDKGKLNGQMIVVVTKSESEKLTIGAAYPVIVLNLESKPII